MFDPGDDVDDAAAVRSQNSIIGPDLGLLCGSLILVDEASEGRTTLDALLGQVGRRLAGPGRTEMAAVMRTASVVVALVLGQDRPQVPFAEDQHPAGDLAPGGGHEPFRISVRPGLRGRDRRDLDTGIGQDRVKRRAELPGSVTDQERKPGTIPRSISRLRICWTVHGPSGFAVTPRMCT